MPEPKEWARTCSSLFISAGSIRLYCTALLLRRIDAAFQPPAVHAPFLAAAAAAYAAAAAAAAAGDANDLGSSHKHPAKKSVQPEEAALVQQSIHAA